MKKKDKLEKEKESEKMEKMDRKINSEDETLRAIQRYIG